MKKVTVSIFVRRGHELLLGFKKRGFGAGRWDGFGGKVEPGETLLEAAKRELLEESGLVAHALQAVAQATFDYQSVPDQIENTVYLCDDFSGQAVETDEMRPRWFKQDSLPYLEMWTDEQLWLPLALQGKKLSLEVHFQDLHEILSYSLVEVENLS